MWQIRKNMFFMCFTAGLALLASKYRINVLQSVKQICHSITKKHISHKNKRNIEDNNGRKELKVSLDKIILADSPEQCDYAVQRIRCNLSDGVLGFDCEWINGESVSLLQLATHNGVCALFRLNKIGFIPLQLRELLASRNFLKVGVASFEDGKKLAKDYNCHVFGTVDLRSLAHSFSLVAPTNLAAFSVQYLGVEIDKVPEIRCGNWNADTLLDEQIKYASCDAYASVLIFYKIMQKARQRRPLWKNLMLYVKYLQNYTREQRFFDLPNEVIDARFKGHKEKTIKNNNNNIIVCSNSNIDKKVGQIIERNSNSDYKTSVPARNKPLYHNCYLQAPDGDILCTCDKKKAEWYVSKQLGEIVQENPLTVRLKFEPSGRASGEVGKYYTQVKVNQCVVCGASDKFIRKNVVPREYRKYFPLVMKSHQSHDVLLLCPSCHEVSNFQDLHLRRKLSEMCDAPLSGPLLRSEESIPKGWKMLQSAVKVLRDGVSLPYERRKELEIYIMKFTGQKEITAGFLNVLHEQLAEKIFQKNLQKKSLKKNIPAQVKNQPHGLKVVQYFEKKDGGLVELEKLWREHFLDTMKPKFLPDLWSVSHNQERLCIRQSENRIEPSDAKVAGIIVNK
ncbi:exonuclease 3'-5' domain-containing protein 2 [Phymastichus coffea]|uniref:exonuclease 3'-5' domain-containing protein 2 n=1 Tax=Phymastichus coffea TaxID=108790 RepID=UPI00273CC950|nr:exonuclease 3'-5' domain-containing protein 2 [Phymastichus coffea]